MADQHSEAVRGVSVRVYVAGSGHGNGVGWAAQVRRGGRVIGGDDGFDAGGTPYRGELLAVLAGLRAVTGSRATVVCANQNIIQTATQWMHGWRKRGWRKKTKGGIEHLELVQALAELDDRMTLRWQRADPNDPAFKDVKEAAQSVPGKAAGSTGTTRSTTKTTAEVVSNIAVAPSPVRLVAYTDGGCRGNPGPGGWGFLLIDTGSGSALERRAGAPNTTNNRMEMMAAIQTLLALKQPGQAIEIRTDSAYLINLASKWMAGWKRRGWKRKGNEPVKNVDLVQQLDGLLAQHRVTWRKVPGHAGEPGNEWADRLTNEAMDGVQSGGDGASTVRHARSPVGVVRDDRRSDAY